MAKLTQNRLFSSANLHLRHAQLPRRFGLGGVLSVPQGEDLPVGTVMSFVGGPFFLWLLIRQRGGRR